MAELPYTWQFEWPLKMQLCIAAIIMVLKKRAVTASRSKQLKKRPAGRSGSSGGSQAYNKLKNELQEEKDKNAQLEKENRALNFKLTLREGTISHLEWRVDNNCPECVVKYHQWCARPNQHLETKTSDADQ